MGTPFAPLPRAPADFTPAKAVEHVDLPDGRVQCGKLEFANRADYDFFALSVRNIEKNMPERLGDFMAVAYHMETTGKLPFQDPVVAPPPHTTADSLLKQPAGPEADGFYHLGTLRVAPADFPEFSKLQHALAKNPEGLAALYQLEHIDDGKPVTFAFSPKVEDNASYSAGDRTIHFGQPAAYRIDANGAHVPPMNVVLHEETHLMMELSGGAELGQIVLGRGNLQEVAVVESVERRAQKFVGEQVRPSYDATQREYPVATWDSTTPSITVRRDGNDQQVHAPFAQSGRVMSCDPDGFTKIAVKGDGKAPGTSMEIRTADLAMLRGVTKAQVVDDLNDARDNNDKVDIDLKRDGRTSVVDRDQEARDKAQQPQAPGTPQQPGSPQTPQTPQTPAGQPAGSGAWER